MAAGAAAPPARGATAAAPQPDPPQAAASLDGDSLAVLAGRFGVEPSALSAFFERIRSGPPVNPGPPARDCVQALSEGTGDNGRFLECLGGSGLPPGDDGLYEALFRARDHYAHRRDDPAALKTVDLLGWVSGLVRARIASGTPGGASPAAGWFVLGRGFTGRAPSDFPFEDGDIVLAMGDTAIAAGIARAPSPRRDYSHSFIVRLRDGQPRVIESQPDAGATEIPWSRLSKRHYSRLLVLRWADAEQRPAVARAAAEIGAELARERAPFDVGMEYSNADRLYCTELVFLAYVRAAHATVPGFPERLEAFVPTPSRFSSDRVMSYVETLGVRSRTTVTPGDFTASPCLTAVAEWETPDSAMDAWQLLLMGDVFFDRIGEGWALQPRWYVRAAVPLARGFNGIVRGTGRLFGQRDWGFIPPGLNGKAVLEFATQERSLLPPVQRAIRSAVGRDGAPATLLDLAPWEMRDHIVQAMSPPWRASRLWRPPEALADAAGGAAVPAGDPAPTGSR